MRLPGARSRHAVLRCSEDASRLTEQATPALDSAVGIEWYEHHGSEVDRAARNLCLLRRARAGEKGSPQHGDEAVGAHSTWRAPRARLDREPRDLRHGRNRIPGGRGTVVSGRRARMS